MKWNPAVYTQHSADRLVGLSPFVPVQFLILENLINNSDD